ncbi:substrate-binding domain-containing protein, partial [uncultured Pseudoalteromonas sp.]|uniref:substrate-binding domain-containing protein n=1 Tax=uncultured Pseudoalteromonas sp. TaxID=114053 RepID=UPI00258D0AAA
MRVCSWLKLFTLLITLNWTSALFAANEQPLRIAVASNFTPILKKLLVEFHQQTNINTQIISGATGALFLQIKHGAPFDVFIAADSTRPVQLEQQNLILANSRKTYASIRNINAMYYPLCQLYL